MNEGTPVWPGRMRIPDASCSLEFACSRRACGKCAQRRLRSIRNKRPAPFSRGLLSAAIVTLRVITITKSDYDTLVTNWLVADTTKSVRNGCGAK